MSSGVPGRLGLRRLARFPRSKVPVVGNGGQQERRGGHADGAHEGVDGAVEWQHDAQEPKDQRCTAQANGLKVVSTVTATPFTTALCPRAGGPWLAATASWCHT